MLTNLLKSLAEWSKYKKESVNFLSLIGQENKELTHSRIIASLLDPNGAHGQGSLLLRLFVATLLPDKMDKLKNFNFESAKVEVEKDFGKLDFDKFDNAIGGRIDIYIEDENNNVIVIENKIFADDQPNQLGRYFQAIRSCKSFEIIYLTLDGHLPSFTSANSTSWRHLNLCSYHEHVIQWLSDSLLAIKGGTHLANILEQYISAVEELTQKYEVAKTITGSSSVMKAAILVESTMETARQMLIRDFMTKLADYCYKHNNYNLEHTEPLMFRDKEGCHLVFNTDLFKIDVCIEWRLFLRVSLTEDGVSKYPEGISIPEGWTKCESPDNLAWKYITIEGEKLDFHNISKPVMKFLDLKDKLPETGIEGEVYKEIEGVNGEFFK